MNSSTALATVLVDELVRGGVTDAVLSPGSRNAPLAFALHAADAAGRLRLHVRVDERTAAFLALGLAKASGAPVPVVTTSGTAAANLHPAVLEASHSGVPLVALTADRPPELRGTGANQTVDQVKLFGDAVRLFADLGTPEQRPGQQASWRSVVCRALAAARGCLDLDPGPVHLNAPLREPLVPDADPCWVEPLEGRPGGRPWTEAVAVAPAVPSRPYAGAPRTLVLVGDCPEPVAAAAARLARDRGWPLLAEPVSGLGPLALPAGTLLLGTPEFLDRHKPERVLVVGRPTLSRSVSALLRDPEVAVDLVGSSPRWPDPASQARQVLPVSALSRLGGEQGDDGFLRAWQAAAETARDAVHALIDAQARLSGPSVARVLLRAMRDQQAVPLLVLGSSSVVRDLELVTEPARRGHDVVANRGAAGIDGTVSTAVGAALAQGGRRHTYALVGDLTFLHDATGLVIGPAEPRPDLTVVVVNDDGGGIFALLEQGAPEHAHAFERVFGTPTGVDLAALCAATRTPHVLAGTPDELRAALVPRAGVRVVEVRTDRRAARDLHARLRAAVRSALALDRGTW